MSVMQEDITQIISKGWSNGKTATEVAKEIIIEFSEGPARRVLKFVFEREEHLSQESIDEISLVLGEGEGA
ncbi:MAG TPA: hypothetical protein VMQ76_04150 [Terracidiphilus sp.]|nr:hypothetical protein [Terracidiphilus sp.]